MSTDKNSPISLTKYDAIPYIYLFIHLFIVPSFRIWGHFPPFRVLGFGSFSAVPCFRIWGIFRGSGVPRFRLLGSPHATG